MDHLERKLIELLSQNKELMDLVDRGSQLGISDWYVGAGGVAQTVRNCLTGKEPNAKIKDYDFVYYDKTDLEEQTEKQIYSTLMQDNEMNIPLEVVNEARVHLRYKQYFHKDIEQYISLEEAIDSWPTTATSIGIRKEGDSRKIYAPYGLEDLFNLIVRPNKNLISQDIYEKKCKEWKEKWPELTFTPW